MRAITPLLLLLVLAAACLPRPGDPIEYLQRENAIIIQMKVVDDADSALAQRLAVPSFTLYGDGTLITAQTTGGVTKLSKSRLPEGAVRDLLEYIDSRRLMIAGYEQQRPDGASGPVTYLYAHTLEAANSVRIEALDEPLPENAGKDWDATRRLQEIAARLLDYNPESQSGTAPSAYEPEAVLLVRETTDGLHEETITDAGGLEQARELFAKGTSTFVTQEGAGGYRPLLPFEENFPEFDSPEVAP